MSDDNIFVVQTGESMFLFSIISYKTQSNALFTQGHLPENGEQESSFLFVFVYAVDKS
jgi:hypothetical protein